VLDETLTALQLVGGALIVGGVVLLSRRSPVPGRSLAGAGEPR
jgi:drug/metabolite transporter (DMT)-like permease